MGWVRPKTQSFVSISVCALLCCNPVCVVAQADELFSQPHALSIRVPDERTNTPYTSNDGKADWTVTAWHIPTGALSIFNKKLTSDLSTYRSQSGPNFVLISYEQGKLRDVTIHQSSAELPCSLENGKAREFDFFLHPNSAENQYEASAVQPLTNGASLDKFKKLFLYAKVSASYQLASERQKCAVNQGSVLLALIIVNRKEKQTLFYQLAIMEVCGGENTVRDVSCRDKSRHPALTVFSDHTPFGIDDKIPLLGQAFLRPLEQRDVKVDVLPRMVQFMKSDAFSGDKDLANWTVSSMTAGQNIWGGIDLQTRWVSMGTRAEF